MFGRILVSFQKNADGEILENLFAIV